MKPHLLAIGLLAVSLAAAVPTAQAETCRALNNPAQVPSFAGIFACAGVFSASSSGSGGSFTITAVGEGQGTPGVTGTVNADLSDGSSHSTSSCSATGNAILRWSCTTGSMSLGVTGSSGSPCATLVVTAKTFDTVLNAVNGGAITAVDTTTINC